MLHDELEIRGERHEILKMLFITTLVTPCKIEITLWDMSVRASITDSWGKPQRTHLVEAH